MEHWITTVQRSKNAQRQRLPGESQAKLALRMTAWWFDALINATLAVSPKTATMLYGAWAADNKGCCSGSKHGVFDWVTMAKWGGRAGGVFSVPSWYSSQKNMRLLAERTAREKDALGPNWQMLNTVTRAQGRSVIRRPRTFLSAATIP